MLHLKQHLKRKLSPGETVVIIAAFALLTVLGFVTYRFTTAQIFEAHVRAAMPRLAAEIRNQRKTISQAIEAYQSHFGFYPPDHVLMRQPLVVDPVTNTLLYELAGTVYHRTNQVFQVDNLEWADAKYVQDFFRCPGFTNCAETAAQVKHFLPNDNVPVRQLHDDPDVFALGFQPSYDLFPPELVWAFEISSWRYVSSAPTNNPGKFDLWVEVKANKQSFTIGNWKNVE